VLPVVDEEQPHRRLAAAVDVPRAEHSVAERAAEVRGVDEEPPADPAAREPQRKAREAAEAVDAAQLIQPFN
jgi:hypothetical protein